MVCGERVRPGFVHEEVVDEDGFRGFGEVGVYETGDELVVAVVGSPLIQICHGCSRIDVGLVFEGRLVGVSDGGFVFVGYGV